MENKILLLEDDEHWHQVIKKALDDEGYEVIVTTTLKKAEEKIASANNQIEAVMLNLNLYPDSPVLDGMGYRLLDYLIKNYPTIPTLVLSAIDNPQKVSQLHVRYNVKYVHFKNGDSNIAELLTILEKLVRNVTYDVFLCHNQIDKPAIIRIRNELKKVGIMPWLDMWDIRPGTRWQDELFKIIGNVKSTAIFIGPNGIGPWQDREVITFLYEFAKRKLPIIPVILPECEDFPDFPEDLRPFHWVDFRISDPDPFNHLLWGITGRRNYLSEIEFKIPADSLKLRDDIRDIIHEEVNKIKTFIVDNVNDNTQIILDQLRTSQIAVIHALKIAVSEAQLPHADWEEFLNFIRDLRQNPPPDKAIANAIQSLPATADDPQYDVTSRVKLTLPIIPMLLAYEVDYELRGNLKLWDILKRIVKKINRTD